MLNDETHDGNSTYYRYSKATNTFTYIGSSKTYDVFTGTDGTAAGTKGLVPAPATTDAGKFLKADGTWAEGGGGESSWNGLLDRPFHNDLEDETLCEWDLSNAMERTYYNATSLQFRGSDSDFCSPLTQYLESLIPAVVGSSASGSVYVEATATVLEDGSPVNKTFLMNEYFGGYRVVYSQMGMEEFGYNGSLYSYEDCPSIGVSFGMWQATASVTLTEETLFYLGVEHINEVQAWSFKLKQRSTKPLDARNLNVDTNTFDITTGKLQMKGGNLTPSNLSLTGYSDQPTWDAGSLLWRYSISANDARPGSAVGVVFITTLNYGSTFSTYFLQSDGENQTWTQIGSQTIGTKTVYYYERTA